MIVKITVLTFLVKRKYIYAALQSANFLGIREKHKSQISFSNLKMIILVAGQMLDLCHDFPPSWPFCWFICLCFAFTFAAIDQM